MTIMLRMEILLKCIIYAGTQFLANKHDNEQKITLYNVIKLISLIILICL